MITRIIVGIIGIALGFVIVWQNTYIVDNVTGRNVWAEKTFGGAGTYTLVKLIGLFVMAAFLLYLTGTLQWIGNSILSIFTGGFINK